MGSWTFHHWVLKTFLGPLEDRVQAEESSIKSHKLLNRELKKIYEVDRVREPGLPFGTWGQRARTGKELTGLPLIPGHSAKTSSV